MPRKAAFALQGATRFPTNMPSGMSRIVRKEQPKARWPAG
jgi:hypothetical protein